MIFGAYTSRSTQVPVGVPSLAQRADCNIWLSQEWVGICPMFCTPLSSMRINNHKQTIPLCQHSVRSFHLSSSIRPVYPDSFTCTFSKWSATNRQSLVHKRMLSKPLSEFKFKEQGQSLICIHRDSTELESVIP